MNPPVFWGVCWVGALYNYKECTLFPLNLRCDNMLEPRHWGEVSPRGFDRIRELYHSSTSWRNIKCSIQTSEKLRFSSAKQPEASTSMPGCKSTFKSTEARAQPHWDEQEVSQEARPRPGKRKQMWWKHHHMLSVKYYFVWLFADALTGAAARALMLQNDPGLLRGGVSDTGVDFPNHQSLCVGFHLSTLIMSSLQLNP